MTSHLSPEVLAALDGAEAFVRGFDGDEIQGEVPGRILRQIAVARLPWRVPRHPGDDLVAQYLRKGGELGFVTIRQYGDSYEVAAFIPGLLVQLPGDTPKTEPEVSRWHKDQGDAAWAFNDMVLEAVEDGWEKVER